MKFDFNTHHLKDVSAGYFKHLAIAMYYNFLALLVLITGVIHAFFPFIFAFTPYNLANKITDGTTPNFKKDN